MRAPACYSWSRSDSPSASRPKLSNPPGAHDTTHAIGREGNLAGCVTGLSAPPSASRCLSPCIDVDHIDTPSHEAPPKRPVPRPPLKRHKGVAAALTPTVEILALMGLKCAYNSFFIAYRCVGTGPSLPISRPNRCSRSGVPRRGTAPSVVSAGTRIFSFGPACRHLPGPSTRMGSGVAPWPASLTSTTRPGPF